MLDRIFRLREHGTTVRREVTGGTITFLALSYILFVQPAILSSDLMTTPMDPGGVFTATCVCSALACLLMGFWANLPVALAPAMGHNVFFAFTVCGAAALAWSWQEALAANLIAGLAFIALAAIGLQGALIRGIPASLKYATAAGIGLLITFVGLQWGGIVVRDPAVYVRMGHLGSPVALLTLFGLAVTGILLVRGVRGAMLIGILATAAAGLLASSHGSEAWGYSLVHWEGEVVSRLPDPGPTAFGSLDGLRSLFTEHPVSSWLAVLFLFLMLDIFDTVGTLMGVAERAGLARDGTVPRAREALISDGIGTVAGTLMGTSTITSYVESAAGISAGARTGLAAVVTGVWLLAALFFYPLAEAFGGTVAVPAAALGAIGEPEARILCHPVVAPVLILIGAYMLPVVARIDWDDASEAIPAFLTIVVMQFALSISHGIAWGFVAWVLLKLAGGRWREIPPLVAVFAALFVVFLLAA